MSNVKDSDGRMPAVKTEYFSVSVGSVHLVEAETVSYFPFFSLFASGRYPENPTI